MERMALLARPDARSLGRSATEIEGWLPGFLAHFRAVNHRGAFKDGLGANWAVSLRS